MSKSFIRDNPFEHMTPLSEQNRVRLALRFGWTMAEVYGRLRQELLWQRTAAATPRLFISDLNPTSGERLWVATRRLLTLADVLFPAAEGRPSDCPPLDLITQLPAQMETLMTLGGKGLPSVDTVYAELNRWGRQCWAQLDAEASVLAEAATLGASLADTFWHMHSPFGNGPATRKETWRYLLTSQRLIAAIRRARRVEPHLPAHVGPMLRHSLWEWSIARELIRSSAGELEIAHSFLYRNYSGRGAAHATTDVQMSLRAKRSNLQRGQGIASAQKARLAMTG